MLSSQLTPGKYFQYFSNLDDAFDSFPCDGGLECLAGDVLKEFVLWLRQRDGWNKLTVSGARKRVVKWLQYRREHGGGSGGEDVSDGGAVEDAVVEAADAADGGVEAAEAADAAVGMDVVAQEDVAVEAVEAVDAAEAAADGGVEAVEAAEAADGGVEAAEAADAAVGMDVVAQEDVAVEAVDAAEAAAEEDSSTPETAAERAERVLVARVDESTRTYTASLVSFLDGVLRGESPDSSGLCLGGVLPVGEHAAPFYRYQVVLRSLLQATDTLGARHMSLLESYSAPCVGGGGSFPSLDDFMDAPQHKGVLDSLRDMIVHETFHGNDMDKIQQWVQQSQAEKARLESLYESEKKAHEQPRPVVADVLLQPVVVQKKKKAQRGGKRKGGNGGEGGSGRSKKKMTNKDVLKKMEQEYCSRDPVVGANDSAFYESVEREIVHGLIGGQGIRSHLAIGIDGGYGLPGMHLKACACAQCQAAEKHGTTVGVDTR